MKGALDETESLVSGSGVRVDRRPGRELGRRGSPDGDAKNATLAGTWSGQYSGAYSGTFTLHWTQKGSKLSGSITLSSPPGKYSVNGSVKGKTIKFGTVGAGATYTGSVSGNTMSGTYKSVPAGGTWSAHKNLLTDRTATSSWAGAKTTQPRLGIDHEQRSPSPTRRHAGSSPTAESRRRTSPGIHVTPPPAGCHNISVFPSCDRIERTGLLSPALNRWGSRRPTWAKKIIANPNRYHRTIIEDRPVPERGAIGGVLSFA